MPISLKATEFVDVKTGDKSLGIRLSTGYSTIYYDAWTSIPTNELDVLKKAVTNSNKDIQAILEYVKVNKVGIEINQKWHEWAQIECCFNIDIPKLM